MSSVYFSVSNYMSDQKYPMCDHVELSDIYDSIKLPVGDPRIKGYIDRGYYDHGVIHDFEALCRILIRWSFHEWIRWKRS